MIRRLEWDGRPHHVVWDSAQPGLGLRVRSQSRTWIIRYRDPDGVSRRKVLGPWAERERRDALTIPQARDLAAKRLARVGDEPIAPARAATLADVWAKYEAAFRRSPRTLRDYRSIWKNHLGPALGDESIARITGGAVMDLHAEMRATPIPANRTVALFSVLFRWAAKRQDLGLPAGALNPAQAVEKYPETPRRRVASPRELRAFLRAVDKCEADGSLLPREALALLLVPYALLRPVEIVRLQWSWVDLDEGVIVLPPGAAKGAMISAKGSKAAEEERVVLSRPVVERLRKLERADEYVVASRRGGPRSDLKIPWAVVKARAKLPLEDGALRHYDFKASAATLLRDAGISEGQIEAASRHRGQGVTARHYSFATDTQARAAVERLAELLEAAKG